MAVMKVVTPGDGWFNFDSPDDCENEQCYFVRMTVCLTDGIGWPGRKLIV